MADVVHYKEFHTLRVYFWGLSTISVALLLYASFEADPTGWLVVTALVLFFVAQVIAAIHRVNRIMLTETHLRVGKETFERSDFDFSFGIQPPLVLSPDEEDLVAEDWPLPPDHELRIAGGAWGRRRGASMIVLREADKQSVVAISTRHPRRLDSLLTEWLESPPNTAQQS